MKELKIDLIKNGTVIDHITSGTSLKVLHVLDIPKPENKDIITVAMNARGKHGRKDIIKIENHEIDTKELNKISLIAPHATINIIRNYEVAEKYHVTLPDEIKDILFCNNPTCITNQREPITTCFIKTNEDPVRLRCYYCDREIDEIAEHIKI